jgi:murein DD-endopeptidase MepM/ murein hydrolase activator NlpD
VSDVTLPRPTGTEVISAVDGKVITDKVKSITNILGLYLEVAIIF